MFNDVVAKISDFVWCGKYYRRTKKLIKSIDKFVGDREKLNYTTEFRIKDGRHYHVEIREIR